MRPRISIRGSVRPSVGPSVRRSVRRLVGRSRFCQKQGKSTFFLWHIRTPFSSSGQIRTRSSSLMDTPRPCHSFTTNFLVPSSLQHLGHNLPRRRCRPRPLPRPLLPFHLEPKSPAPSPTQTLTVHPHPNSRRLTLTTNTHAPQ